MVPNVVDIRRDFFSQLSTFFRIIGLEKLQYIAICKRSIELDSTINSKTNREYTNN